jgi:hypothetical protein
VPRAAQGRVDSRRRLLLLLLLLGQVGHRCRDEHAQIGRNRVVLNLQPFGLGRCIGRKAAATNAPNRSSKML